MQSLVSHACERFARERMLRYGFCMGAIVLRGVTSPMNFLRRQGKKSIENTTFARLGTEKGGKATMMNLSFNFIKSISNIYDGCAIMAFSSISR